MLWLLSEEKTFGNSRDGYHLVYEEYDFRRSSSWYPGGAYVYK